MATLNQDEQAKVDALAALEQAKWNGEPVWDGDLKQARWLAEHAEANAEARERFQQQRKAEEDAENARRQARRDAEVLAAQDAYKRTARATFPGTQAQFEGAWPDILRAWQVRNTAGDADALIADALIERKRASMEYGF